MSKSKKVLSVLFASAILMGGANAYASSSPEKQAAFERAKVSAAQAVQAATAKVPGKATEVDFNFKYGEGYYKVDVIQNNQGSVEKHEVVVNANTGAVIGDSVEHKSHKVRPEVNISLEKALSIAEKTTGGKVKEAELDREHGSVRYEIESIKDGRTYKTVIDAHNGNVIHSGIDY